MRPAGGEVIVITISQALNPLEGFAVVKLVFVSIKWDSKLCKSCVLCSDVSGGSCWYCIPSHGLAERGSCHF